MLFLKGYIFESYCLIHFYRLLILYFCVNFSHFAQLLLQFCCLSVFSSVKNALQQFTIHFLLLSAFGTCSEWNLTKKYSQKHESSTLNCEHFGWWFANPWADTFFLPDPKRPRGSPAPGFFGFLSSCSKSSGFYFYFLFLGQGGGEFVTVKLKASLPPFMWNKDC